MKKKPIKKKVVSVVKKSKTVKSNTAEPFIRNEEVKKFNFNGETFNLPDRAKLFCMEYVRNRFNATEAAKLAGYSEKTCYQQGYRLLTNVEVQKYVEALKKDIAFAIGIDAIAIAKEYAKIGFSDVRQIFDKDGNLIQIKDIPDDAAMNIASVEVFEEYQGRGETREYIGQTKKVKFYDKVNALDKLAKMTGVDGVTKVAQTNANGTDIIQLPKKEFNDNK